jgi:hypothetical protein
VRFWATCFSGSGEEIRHEPVATSGTGEETITSDLTYDLRSGDPDFTDKLVALTFGNMAYDAILDAYDAILDVSDVCAGGWLL